MPEARPHTVHASSSSYNVSPAEQAEAEDEVDQTTPRASLAARPGFGAFANTQRRRLSRDDTALDVSEAVLSLSEQENAWARYYAQRPQAQFAAWTDAGAFAADRGQVRPQFQQPVTLLSNVPQSHGSTEISVNQAKEVRSLGRRFSRNYKEKMQGLKASLPSRMRRASTPHNAEPAVQSNAACIDSRHLVAPLSPSKRNHRYGSDVRARKFRAFGITNNDRKDTPAPIAFGVASRPAPRPIANAWQLPGGESARAAAAACRSNSSAQQIEEDAWAQQEAELQVRRGRLGSLSSAQDSGADLSYNDEDSCKDSVGEVDDMELDEEPEKEAVKLPKRQDFVEALPSEIALQIFEYLDAQHLVKAQCVGPAWKAMADETSIWKAAFLRKYDRQVYSNPAPVQVGGVGAGRLNRSKQEWKRMYQARLELERNWRLGPKLAGKAVYLSGHTDSVYCLQFDEEKIITGSRDRTIRVWDINTFQCIRVIGGPSVKPILGPKVLRTVDYPHFHLATASVNGTAYGEGIYQVPSQWHDASILCLQYDDKILVTGSSDSDLLVWDIHTYEPIHRLRKHNGGVLDVALDAKHIVSCSKDSRIIVWDRETYEPKGELTGHRGPVNAVQLRGKYLVSASGDGIARMWDIEQMKLVKEFSAKERGLAAVEFSEDMKYVLAGGNDHITYKFEVETGLEVKQFTGHTQLVRSLWLDSANDRVVSGSYDLDLRVYDFVTGEEMWRAEEWTTSWMLAAKSDYRRIVATSQDGRILIVDFGLQKGGITDGQPMEGVDLLRGVEKTNAVLWRDPWTGATIGG